MNKYLISAVNTVRVHTVGDVEALHEELKHNPEFELVQFSYTTKDIKEKREVVDSYAVVKYKIVFQDEKEPERQIDINYDEQ